MPKHFIFIGDLEGCIKYAKFSKKTDNDLQNRGRCSKAFFDALRTKLTDEKYHICFQGDYFDNGDLVEDTLLELANLKKDYEDRIHIILGNRDLNKFRIYYELKLKSDDISDEDVFIRFGMKGWKAAYEEKVEDKTYKWEDLNDKKKLHKLLKGTMGAELHDPEGLGDQKENQEKIIKLLLEAFTPDNFESDVTEITDAKDAIAYIFKNGKIADFDEETGLLMSHAGGYSQAIFEKPLETPSLEKTNYFEKIDEAIHNLHYKDETAPAVSDNVSVSEIVESHNEVYTKFLEKFKSKPNSDAEPDAESKSDTEAEPDAEAEAPQEHFYLVAMGLKPIMKPSWRFKSFIETCSHKNDFSVKPPVSAFNEKQDLPSQIKVVAYGHLNTFQNYPFIYKRNGLILLSNDVSVARSPMCESIYLIGYGDNKVTTYKYDNVNNKNLDIEKIKELDEIKEYTEKNADDDDDASKSKIEWETHNNYFKLNINESAKKLEKAANNAREIAETMKKKKYDGATELQAAANDSINTVKESGGRKKSTRKKRKRKTIKKNKKKRKTIKKNRKTIKKKRKARKN